MRNIISEYCAKTLKAYKTGGVGLIIKRAIKKLFATNSALWFERDISHLIEEFRPKIPVEVSLLSNSETLEWLRHEDRAWMIDPQEIKLGLEQGHYFPNVKYKGEIIGCVKVGFNEVYIADYKKSILFPGKMAFHTDVYMVPEYRGLGIASFLLTEVMRFLKDKGLTKIRCHIPAWNTVSINTHVRVGFKKSGYIRYFKIFGISILTGDPVRLKSI